MSEGRQAIVRLLGGITAFFLLLTAVVRPLSAANLFWVDEYRSRLGDTIFVSLPVWFALVFWLLRALTAGRLAIYRAGADLLLLPFLFLVLLSPRPPADLNAALPAAMVWTTNILYLYLVINVGREARFARWVLAALLSTAVVVTVHAAIQVTVELPALKQRIQNDPGLLEEHLRREGNPEVLEELRNRATTARPFSVFLNENTLAAFLVLAFFPLLGLFIEAPSGNWRQGVRAVLLVGMFVIVGLTYSKGGALAFAVGLYAFLFAARVGWFSRPAFRRASVAVGLVAVAALVALSWTPLDPLGILDSQSSAGVRIGYWTGAIRVFLAHPWLGVGLENFPQYYYEVKDADAGEVNTVHNDYLQVAVDLGVFAFLAFVGFWGWTLLRSFRAPAADAPREGTIWLRLMPLVIASVSSAILGPYIAQGVNDWGLIESIEPPYSAFALSWAWIVGFIALRPAPRQPTSRWVRAGTLAGLCAVLAHAIIDSDFYAHNLSFAIWALAGVVIVLAQDARGDGPVLDLEMGTGGRLLVLFVTGSIVAVLAAAVVPVMRRAQEQEEIYRKAREAGAAPDSFRASQLAPWDPRPLFELAAFRHGACQMMTREKLQEQTGRVGQPITVDATRYLPDLWRLCIPYLDDAIKLSPREHDLWYRLGRFHEEHAERAYEIAALEEGPQREALEQYASEALNEAARAYLEAVRLYPSKPEYSLRIGRVRERQGRASEAEPHLRKALDLHRIQVLERLRLPKEEIEDLERRFGGR